MAYMSPEAAPAFDPRAWFWRAEDGRVYSSAAGASVPNDDAGYRAWCEAGGIATVWPRDDEGAQTDAALDAVLVHYGLTAGAVPDIASAQALIQLARTPGSGAGTSLLDDAKATVAAAGIEAQSWFDRAQTWQRQNSFVLQVGAALGLTSAAIDDLFRQAATIGA